MKKNLIFFVSLVVVLVTTQSNAYSQEDGTITDDRDGQTYKTVTIGSQTWMAKNLNYDAGKESYCYENNPSNCEIYGRLYTWTPAKKSCPEGWHLPGDE
ncbi:MAG: hypothetical protein K8R53_11630 [Bacteroidales bacterium]|nr:hypothetical protein [Bacteroidales bacterium]